MATPDLAGPELARVQTRTVRLLMLVEVISGLGVAMGISVGALLTQRLAGTALSGVAQSFAVIGGALAAVPVSALMQRRGRRPGMALCYLVGAIGGAIILASAVWESVPLLFLGFFIFGAGNAAKLQARYAAVDLAEPAKRGRQLSLVVWATTLGAIFGPNLADPFGKLMYTHFQVMELAGPFAFASLSFLVGALLLSLFLRPDPLLLSQQVSGVRHEDTKVPLTQAARAVWVSPGARLGIAATSMGHLVMVGVMSMTPLHIGHTHPADTVRLVGFVISVHIAGMYGLSPVVGWLTDKVGRKQIILLGVALLVAACAVAGTAGDGIPQLTVALAMLGLGWSCTMVAGSTLFAESVEVQVKARAQGLSDLVTGLTGATAGVLSGVVVEGFGYPTLTLIAALCTIPLVGLAFRPVSPAVAD